MSSGKITILEIGGWADNGKTVPSHGSPAVPGDLGFAIDGGDEIGSSGVAELLDSGGGDGGIKASKLHHRAKSETIFEWRNADFVFWEKYGMSGTVLRAFHGHGVAFAGLNRDLTLQFLRPALTPGSHREDKVVGLELP